MPEKKKRPSTNYYETDIDSGSTRDLAIYNFLRYQTPSAISSQTISPPPLYENLESSSSPAQIVSEVISPSSEGASSASAKSQLEQQLLIDEGNLNKCLKESKYKKFDEMVKSDNSH